jgi:hypothetical protein
LLEPLLDRLDLRVKLPPDPCHAGRRQITVAGLLHDVLKLLEGRGGHRTGVLEALREPLRVAPGHELSPPCLAALSRSLGACSAHLCQCPVDGIFEWLSHLGL